MKKIAKVTSITLGVLALSTSLTYAAQYKGDYKSNAYPQAPASVYPTALNDGPYAGIAGGYDSYGARENVNYAAGVGAGILSNSPIRVNGFVGGLFAGYGKYFENLYYLGAEIFGNYSSANDNNTISVFSTVIGNTNIKARGGFGVSILPGIKPTETTLVYAKLGYNRSNFRVQENLTNTGVPSYSSVSSSNWGDGINYGIGIETAIYERFSLRGEFTHTDFGSFRNAALPNNVGGAATQFSVADNQFMLGLVYHIECTE